MRISSHLKFIGWLFSSRSLMWDCFFRKQILQLNEQYQHFHQFSSKQSKARVFLKGNIFHGVARYERMKNWAKFAQNAILLHCPFLFIENLTFPSSISFPVNMEGSKRNTTCIGHLSSSTKNKQKKNLMTESLLSNDTSNCFNLITTPTRGKTCGLCSRNGTITLLSGKLRTVDNSLL